MTTQTKLIRKEELRFKKVVTADPGKDLRESNEELCASYRSDVFGSAEND